MQYISLRWSSQFIFTRPFKGKGVIINDIFARQEIISICFAHGYNLLWKLVYAFDRVNHSLLFDKLCARGVPFYLIRLLVYWYEHQRMCVRWGGVYSSSFTGTNGVRQGGILSPYLFNVYVNDLSVKLNSCHVGCYWGQPSIYFPIGDHVNVSWCCSHTNASGVISTSHIVASHITKLLLSFRQILQFRF